MKIYLLPVDDKYYIKPRIDPFCKHSPGYNVETQFHKFLKSSDYLTDNPDEADWHYLPLYWSYWTLANDYGRKNREELDKYLQGIVIDYRKTFTVSEADGEPNFSMPIRVFSANLEKLGWTPIPIITLPHAFPEKLPEKKYLASFYGSLKTHPIRMEMKEKLKHISGVNIVHSTKVQDEEGFVKSILESYSTLCPRGSAMGSYRFYESMQLGVVPIMIADYDFRPFPEHIDWDKCSFYFKTVDEAKDFLEGVGSGWLENMSKAAQLMWNVIFNNWEETVLKYL